MKKLIIFLLFLPGIIYADDFCITIATNNVTRVVNDFAARFGYQDTIRDPNNPDSTIPNPVSKRQFMKNMIRDYIKSAAVSYEADQDAGTARANTLNQANQALNITAP